MQGTILIADRKISLKNNVDHLLARLGINRMGYLVTPGLYRFGDPGPESPVFITANYTLSFDALRSSLKEIDCFILVLNTFGINVWCAAGKGTFGTEELIRKIDETRLHETIKHRTLILPQLGAPGVSAHRVKEKTGFNIKYGPVRAADIPDYLGNKKISAGARRVKFTLLDRLILIPVEFIHVLLPMLILSGILYLTVGLMPALALASAMIAGSVLFPVLLPWLPTKNFSTKGFILGGVVAFIFGSVHILNHSNQAWVFTLISTMAYILSLPPVTAFLALNFTGATTFTSRSGVRKEIYAYFPAMVWMFAAGMFFFSTAIIVSLTVSK
ncbi:MAG: carbon monoxide dehydrogenase [Bacteroides sp. SM23_62]|nr:MAG: carbon monoxide dehydrogenase [Bacteroides sp. SM23_62]